MSHIVDTEDKDKYAIGFIARVMLILIGLALIAVSTSAFDINIDAICALPWWRIITGSTFLVAGVYCITNAFEDDDDENQTRVCK